MALTHEPDRRQERIDALVLELARMRRDLDLARDRVDRLAAIVDDLQPAKAELTSGTARVPPVHQTS